jgi:hypothetical protein
MAREYQPYDVLVYHDFDSFVTPHEGMKGDELGFCGSGSRRRGSTDLRGPRGDGHPLRPTDAGIPGVRRQR